jgi:uncharacterized protein involved in exopolysaccharide biosynthesis
MKHEPSAEEAIEGSDYQRVRDLVLMIARAPKRRRKLAWAIFVIVALLSVAAAILTPRSYEASVKILAQRNLLMPALGNPHRSVPYEADAPTKNVTELILARDNLVSLVKDTNLVDKWQARRPPLLKLKDNVTGLTGANEEDKMRALVGTLEKTLRITSDDTTVSIALEWNDPDTAYELVSTLEKNFLDGKHAAEVAVISDALAILEQHASQERDGIAAALAELQRLRDEKSGGSRPAATAATPAGAPAPRPATPRAGASGAAQQDQELLRLIDEKRRQIRQATEERQRRINELKTQLADMRTTYAPAHPSIVGLEKKLEAASEEPPELINLKNEERALLAQIAGAPAPVLAPRPAAAAAPRPGTTANVAAEAQAPRAREPDEDAQVAVARTKLQNATVKYQDLMDRIDGAHIELETARAAFKYKYRELTPPEIPRKPKKPNVPILVLGGLLLALILGVFASAAADLASGRFVEPWQVRRRLRLPVLGDVTRP